MHEMASFTKWAASSTETISNIFRMKEINIENTDVLNKYKASDENKFHALQINSFQVSTANSQKHNASEKSTKYIFPNVASYLK